jgi:hypothetical protein
MDLLQTFEGPVIESVRGEEVKFPRLEIDDYLPWIAELTAQHKLVARAKIPASADQSFRWGAERKIHFLEVGFDVIADEVWKVPGAKRVLTMSLIKGGATKDQAEQIIQKVRPFRLHDLAVEVSSLFERKPIPPNGQAATGTNPAAGSTGSIAGSESPSTPAEIPVA